VRSEQRDKFVQGARRMPDGVDGGGRIHHDSSRSIVSARTADLETA
jgi:hypothetical protein